MTRNNAPPESVLMDVPKNYLDIAEQTTGEKLILSDNPKTEISAILRDQFSLIGRLLKIYETQ